MKNDIFFSLDITDITRLMHLNGEVHDSMYYYYTSTTSERILLRDNNSIPVFCHFSYMFSDNESKCTLKGTYYNYFISYS